MDISTSPSVGMSIKSKQERLYTLCHDYLIDNFHKFSDANKLKVALVLASKMAPQQIEGAYNITKMETVKADTKELEYNLGTRASSFTENTN